MPEKHQKGEEKKRRKKNRHRFSCFSSMLASSLLSINLSALICPPFWITWLELKEVVERQVNNLCRSLDHQRGSCWFCLDSSSWTELNRAEQINCRGFGFFSPPFNTLFWNQNKRFPQLAELPDVFATADRHFLLPSFISEEDALCSERGGENLWRHQSPAERSPTRVLMRDDHPARVRLWKLH